MAAFAFFCCYTGYIWILYIYVGPHGARVLCERANTDRLKLDIAIF